MCFFGKRTTSFASHAAKCLIIEMCFNRDKMRTRVSSEEVKQFTYSVLKLHRAPLWRALSAARISDV